LALTVRGPIKYGERTKELIGRLEPGDIAVIDHADVDELAATGLIERRVAAVVNLSKSLTGKYPCPGPKLLLKAGIPIFDCVDGAGLRKTISGFAEAPDCCLDEHGLTVAGQRFDGVHRDLSWVETVIEQTREGMHLQLTRFVENTLDYAHRELHDILRPQDLPGVETSMDGRHVLVVVRGKDYRDDLEAIRGYIAEFRPVLIGVDGGADALLDLGWRPDVILGDMDSVSDRALCSGAELIVHAYPDGRAPGRRRLDDLGCDYLVLPLQGTSEDAALLLAYEFGAELLVAVGTHTSAVDFLEKGRPGMASTLLVRLKVAPILVDAKGVSKVYRRHFHRRYAAALLVGALIPMAALVAVVTPLQLFVRLLVLKVRLWVGL